MHERIIDTYRTTFSISEPKANMLICSYKNSGETDNIFSYKIQVKSFNNHGLCVWHSQYNLSSYHLEICDQIFIWIFIWVFEESSKDLSFLFINSCLNLICSDSSLKNKLDLQLWVGFLSFIMHWYW